MEQEHKVRGTGRFHRLAITFALAGLVIVGSCVLFWQPAPPITQEPIARLGKGTIRQVQFTPDGKYVALGTSLGVELRDPATLEQRAFFEAPGFGTVSGEMHITNDGKRIAVAGSGAIALWDVETKQRTAVLGGEKSPWRSFQFSPDGMLCAASTPAGVEIRSGDGKRRIATIKGSASALRFSPDGELLAGMTWRASPDGNKESAFRVWKIASYAPPVWMPRILTAVMVVVTLLIAFLSLLVFKKRIRSKRWRLAVVLLGGVAGFLIASFWVNPLIFRIPSCREIATIPLEKSVTQAFFSPDGSLLFLGGGVQGAGLTVAWGGFQGGGDTVIWDVSTNQGSPGLATPVP